MSTTINTIAASRQLSSSTGVSSSTGSAKVARSTDSSNNLGQMARDAVSLSSASGLVSMLGSGAASGGQNAVDLLNAMINAQSKAGAGTGNSSSDPTGNSATPDASTASAAVNSALISSISTYA